MSSDVIAHASPALAYRADMRGRLAPFGDQDDAWLAAAATLHLASSPSMERQSQLLDDAVLIAENILSESTVLAFVQREWNGTPSRAGALMILADTVHWAGALHLAAQMLDDLLLATPGADALSRGRLLALRARICWKLGRFDDAIERYEYISDLGKRSRIPELEARAEVGLASIAQQRGNFPDVQSHAEKAAAIADKHGFRALARLAYHGLAIAASKNGRASDALLAGWKMLQLSIGDEGLEVEALQNIGQAMLESGHADIARSSFAAVLGRSKSMRVVLSALGSLAVASAKLGLEATVEWSIREVSRATTLQAVPHYELADSLLECATALWLLGRVEESNAFRHRAAAIGVAHGFHELSYRASTWSDSSMAGPQAVPFAGEAARVAQRVVDLEPERLPEHVAFESAPA